MTHITGGPGGAEYGIYGMATMTDTDDPIAKFKGWLAEAEKSEPNNANAMTLATATAEGRPSARMVLLKGVDDNGFVFYTNTESRKGGELFANPHAALLFHWKSRGRQVRVEGPVTTVSDDEADTYFASRDRGSRIGAWASSQSRAMAGRFDLEKRVAEFTAKFNVGDVPRPEHWTGFRIRHEVLEFWSEGLFRLHERIVYRRDDADGDAAWRTERLFP